MNLTEETQEQIISAFSDATGCPSDDVKVSITNADRKYMILQGTRTEANGESTTTNMVIEDIGQGKYRFSGRMESSSLKRSLSYNREIQTTPQGIQQVIRQILAVSRVCKRSPHLINKIGSKLGSYI